MKLKLFVLFLTILFTSCSRYPGYKKLTSEIYYSLIQFGDDRQKALPGDYVTISIEYRTQKDSVFFSGQRKVRVNEPIDDASLDNCFLHICSGDSASFILPAVKFFASTLKSELPDFISEDAPIKINMRLENIQTGKEFLAEKELFLLWSAELSEYENRILRQYLKDEKLDIQPKPEGFFLIPLREGNGLTVRKGDHLWVNYEGKFLNGKYFDGTYRSKEPVDFIYGTQYMLISGLDMALKYMDEGEKAMIILPSGLAFGDKGDSFGLIPPYTSLIYTLEIIKIER
ncbi:MAG: FKBP-type peptidyl-prolyl cis-trans isomerase [Bacteroidales bacterium]|nr:FKBP-type peptidyl-prolyl cis-trans isomerase [Bacteroidales bacterium]